MPSAGPSTNIPVAGFRGRLEGPDGSGLEVGRRAGLCGVREPECGVVRMETGGRGSAAGSRVWATAGIGAWLSSGAVWSAVDSVRRGAETSTSVSIGAIDGPGTAKMPGAIGSSSRTVLGNSEASEEVTVSLAWAMAPVGLIGSRSPVSIRDALLSVTTGGRVSPEEAAADWEVAVDSDSEGVEIEADLRAAILALAACLRNAFLVIAMIS